MSIGALTQLILQERRTAPVFLTDLVDVDADDTALWSGIAGRHRFRCDAGSATATIHTNRKMPLLYEFTLKPGR